MELKTSYRPGPSPGCPISWKHHGLLVCGDAGVNKSLALPVVQMCSTHNHAQYITPENNDKRPRYRLRIHYTLDCYFRMNPLLIKRKSAVNSMSCYACSSLGRLVFPRLDSIIFSLVPDSISCRFINVVSPM